MNVSKYVPYHEASVAYAKNLTKNMVSDMEKYKAITNFVTKSFAYDYVRAITIPKKNGLPDIDRCWNKKMGICLDIASMTTGMLRAVGLDAVLCFGHTEKTYHAWVETKIGTRKYRYDHDGTAKVYRTERTFT